MLRAVPDCEVRAERASRRGHFPALLSGHRVSIGSIASLVLTERARMAREIHDTLLQGLVGLALGLDELLRRGRSTTRSGMPARLGPTGIELPG